MIPRPARFWFAGSVLLAALSACNKQPAQSVGPNSEHQPLLAAKAPTSLVIVDKNFNVKTSATFPFEVPAHVVRPHLHGIFQSFVGQVHGDSDDRANVDLLLMNEQQQADFVNHREGEVLFSVEASHNQSVNFDLPSSMNDAAKYYLVFRSTGTGAKVVEANIRVDF